MEYNIRIDNVSVEVPFQLEAFLTKIDKECSHIIAVHEIAKRTKKKHYHVLLRFLKPVKHEALRKRVYRHFTHNTKRESRSIQSVKKPLNNLIYICKDKNFVKLKGYTKEECMQFGEEYVDYKEKARLDKLKKSKSVMNEILDDMDDKKEYTRMDIAKIVHKHFVGKPMNFNYMKSVYEGIYALKHPQESLELFLTKLDHLFIEDVAEPIAETI